MVLLSSMVLTVPFGIVVPQIRMHSTGLKDYNCNCNCKLFHLQADPGQQGLTTIGYRMRHIFKNVPILIGNKSIKQ